MEKTIEIPFGAKDSELKGWEYTIPEGMEAEIKDGKVIVREKESEDNRIRKEIIEFINWAESRGSVRNDWHQKKCPEEWIAYLERQKEQKTDCKYGCGLTDEQLMATDFWKEYLKESIIPGNKPTKADIDFLLPIARKYFSLVMKEACTICKEWSNGYQKGLEAAEQKPAEWSEEYRKEDLRTRFAFYTYKDEDSVLYLSNVFVEETSRNKGFGTKILQAAEMVAQTIGALTIRLKVKQNTSANDWYRRHGYGYLVFEDGYDWLEKNLEYLKPKQEWSERDKLHLNNAILVAKKEWGVNSYTARFLEALRDNYKKCNSRWKPSEEQMKEYSYWYKNFIESGLASPSSKAVTILGELLEQLKKL